MRSKVTIEFELPVETVTWQPLRLIDYTLWWIYTVLRL